MTTRPVTAYLEAIGHSIFYLVMRLFGHRGGLVLLVPVMSIYVLCSRRIHEITGHYLRRRFPGESRWRYWLHTHRNLMSFGRVLVERGWLGSCRGASLQCDFHGKELLLQHAGAGKGVVLLIAHVGNWQSALAHLTGMPVQVHALMRYDQQAVAKHFFDVQGGRAPFAIIDAEGPFGGMVDALGALQRGEVVTIMGDRYVKGSQQSVPFFGDPVRVPDSAYMLAASAGSPVLVLLSAQTGPGRHELKVWDLFFPEFCQREERSQVLRECAGRFMMVLERYLQQYPYQWYNFYNFWKQ